MLTNMFTVIVSFRSSNSIQCQKSPLFKNFLIFMILNFLNFDLFVDIIISAIQYKNAHRHDCVKVSD